MFYAMLCENFFEMDCCSLGAEKSLMEGLKKIWNPKSEKFFYFYKIVKTQKIKPVSTMFVLA